MRFAAYIRISSEDQVGNYSIDAQKRAIQAWVAARNDILIKTYTDEAYSGRSADRPAFKEMRRDAKRKIFDAIVVHKFDRFARNRTESLAIKSLLRHDYGIKIYSVSEPSEDANGAMGALIEGVMESIADWYSRNLSAETSKGKKERIQQGIHNNAAPFGMKKDASEILVPDPETVPGLILAFETYATGRFSFRETADILNEAGYLTTKGRPFSADTVRSMIANRTYLGQVKYRKYVRKAGGGRSYKEPAQWFEGKHDAVISEELFNQCREAANRRRIHRQAAAKYRPYLLRGLIYCHECCTRDLGDIPAYHSYGKMRSNSYGKYKHSYYRCMARNHGIKCTQKTVRVEKIDAQVVHIIKQLHVKTNWREKVAQTIRDLLGEKQVDQRLAEISKIIERMDTRWDHGFITDQQDYMMRRLELQQEMERLKPIPETELEQALHLLTHFSQHWNKLEDQLEEQHELLKLIIKRVYVVEDSVVAITLRSNLHLELGGNEKGSIEISIDPFCHERD